MTANQRRMSGICLSPSKYVNQARVDFAGGPQSRPEPIFICQEIEENGDGARLFGSLSLPVCQEHMSLVDALIFDSYGVISFQFPQVSPYLCQTITVL